MKKDQNEYVELVYKKLRLVKSLEAIEKLMNQFLIDEELYLENAKKQLTEFELKIVKEYGIKGKTFQTISEELSCPYRRVRDTWISANDKLTIIANFLDE